MQSLAKRLDRALGQAVDPDDRRQMGDRAARTHFAGAPRGAAAADGLSRRC